MKKLENSFAVTGFISNDAEMRNFKAASVARFSLVVSRGEKLEDKTRYISSFVNIEAWRKNEAAGSFDILRKGNLVTVEGFFKPEEWQGDDGRMHNRIILVATKFYPTPEKEEQKPAQDSSKSKAKGRKITVGKAV